MKTIGLTVLSALTALALVASPAVATKKKASGPTCAQIKDAMKSGKTAEEVEKDLNTTSAKVKNCTAPAKHHKTTHKAS